MDLNTLFSSSNGRSNFIRYFQNLLDSEIQTLQSFNITIDRNSIEPSEFNVRLEFESEMFPPSHGSLNQESSYFPIDLNSLVFSDFLTPTVRTNGLSSDHIENVSSKIIIDGSIDCHICLDTLLQGSCMRQLTRCSHKFCVDCIDEWLHCHNTCPVCKTVL